MEPGVHIAMNVRADTAKELVMVARVRGDVEKDVRC